MATPSGNSLNVMQFIGSDIASSNKLVHSVSHVLLLWLHLFVQGSKYDICGLKPKQGTQCQRSCFEFTEVLLKHILKFSRTGLSKIVLGLLKKMQN